MSEKRKIPPIKSPLVCDDQLESFTDLRTLVRFIFRTWDGYYLIFLSAIYLFWAVYLLTTSKSETTSYWPVVSAYPILLLIIYIRHRIGTCSSDHKPILFSFISLTSFAIVPIYIIFWR